MAILPTIEEQISASNKALRVKILSPRQELLNTQAFAVSSINSAGPFDVLTEHGNFITLVQNKQITIRLLNNKVLTYIFPLTVIYARKNLVTIFTDIQLELLTS